MSGPAAAGEVGVLPSTFQYARNVTPDTAGRYRVLADSLAFVATYDRNRVLAAARALLGRVRADARPIAPRPLPPRAEP